MIRLDIQNLRVELNKNRILDDLSLTVADGEFVSLLGPSGCGKSTLLKTIAGINHAVLGDIILDGERINDKPAYKRGAVIVFQDMRLFPNMSVAENVAYPLRIQGIRKKERVSRAAEFIRSVQLEGLEDRRIYQLSGGQQQRVALARALAARPRLLLLDEPFSSLDENLREDMRRLVRDLHRQFKMTTIMVTHDRQEALAMADRVAVMFGGSIAMTGTPEEVLSDRSDRRISEYFGANTLVRGRVQDGIFTASDGSGLTCRLGRPDGEYDLMLRTDIIGHDSSPESELPAGSSMIH